MEKMQQEKKDYMKEYHRKKKKALHEPIVIPESLNEKLPYEPLRE